MAFDWKKVVRSIAPVIGSIIPGPFGSMALTALSDALLGKPDGTEEEIEQAIKKATPEQIAAIKKADQDFKVKLRELDIDELELHGQDRQSARNLFSVNIYPQMALSGVFIIGYFAILYYVLSGVMSSDTPTDVKMLIAALIGVITGEIPRIMAFWFGSSTGSKEKTAKLAK
jgi:hypothetical protein